MPTILSKWIREKLAIEKKRPPLPILDSQRPCILTPSASHESLILSAAPATANSAFFQRLPFELRQKILIEALGNRTVHMDLRFDRPMLVPQNRQQDVARCHANVAAPSLKPKPDRSKPKRWLWWSSVCHRAGPGGFGSPMSEEAYEDECRQGESSWCEFWPGEKPGKCFIGAMGWLLSCRQAYAEGVDILYSTNTIHMASAVMISNLPQLLLPQRLDSITFVEMVWHLRPFQDAGSDDPPDSSLETFHNLLDVLPPTFPHLKKLYISLQGDMQPRDAPYEKRLDVTESAIMRPVDDMVRRVGSCMQECNIAIPTSLYQPRKSGATVTNLLWGRKARGEWERFWRELPETEMGGGSAHLRGYWVRHGQGDMRMTEVSCFGGGFPKDS